MFLGLLPVIRPPDPNLVEILISDNGGRGILHLGRTPHGLIGMKLILDKVQNCPMMGP